MHVRMAVHMHVGLSYLQLNSYACMQPALTAATILPRTSGMAWNSEQLYIINTYCEAE